MADKVQEPKMEALIAINTEDGIIVARKRDTGQVSDDKLAAILSNYWTDPDSVMRLIRFGALRTIFGYTFDADPAYPNIYRGPEENCYPLSVADVAELEAHARDRGIKRLFLFDNGAWSEGEVTYTWKAAATSTAPFGTKPQ